jgi:hypothetical protein
MKKRALLTFTVVFGLAAVTCMAWRSLTPAHRINGSSISQIQVGMALLEVESVFGVPPGDYSEQTKHNWTPSCDTEGFPQGWRCETWKSTNAVCNVYFDHDDKVLALAGCHEGISFPSWLDQIKSWFGV